jgi:rare lipoprotein A
MPVAVFLLATQLAGCTRQTPPPRPAADLRAPQTPEHVAPPVVAGTYKVGAPYQVRGRWYTPREEPGYDRTGVASWYGGNFHNRLTANGERFDAYRLTAAHPTLPLPSHVYVTNLANGRTVLVRVNDRGPFIGERIIDLSRYTARVLGLEGQGVGNVRVRYAGRAPLDGNTHAEQAFLARQPWYGGGGLPTAGIGWHRMGLGARPR